MSVPGALFAIKAATQVATAAVTVMSQAGAAEAQEEMNAREEASIREANQLNYDQLALMHEQQREQAEQALMENDTEALKATERAQAAAGEAGVTGLSVDALLADMYGRQARYTDSVEQNLKGAQTQIEFEKRNAQVTSQSQLNSLPVPDQPDYFGAALRAGNGIFGAYKDHLKVK